MFFRLTLYNGSRSSHTRPQAGLIAYIALTFSTQSLLGRGPTADDPVGVRPGFSLSAFSSLPPPSSASPSCLAGQYCLDNLPAVRAGRIGRLSRSCPPRRGLNGLQKRRRIASVSHHQPAIGGPFGLAAAATSRPPSRPLLTSHGAASLQSGRRPAHGCEIASTSSPALSLLGPCLGRARRAKPKARMSRHHRESRGRGPSRRDRPPARSRSDSRRMARRASLEVPSLDDPRPGFGHFLCQDARLRHRLRLRPARRAQTWPLPPTPPGTQPGRRTRSLYPSVPWCFRSRVCAEISPECRPRHATVAGPSANRGVSLPVSGVPTAPTAGYSNDSPGVWPS